MKNSEMKIKKENSAPFSADLLLMLLPALAAACFIYGGGVLKTAAVSAAAAVLCDFFARFLILRRTPDSELDALSDGVLIALMSPADIPLYIPALISSLSVIIFRLPFCNSQKKPLSPALLGFSAALLLIPDALLSFPLPQSGSALTEGLDVLLNGSAVNFGSVDFLNIFAGNFPAAAGASCLAVMLAGLLYLLLRRRAAAAAIGFIGAGAVYAVFFPRVYGSPLSSVLAETGGGLLLFTAVYLLPAALSQKRAVSCLLWGIAGGALCMLFRNSGFISQGAVFAAAIINLLSAALDIIAAKIKKRRSEAESAQLQNNGKAEK